MVKCNTCHVPVPMCIVDLYKKVGWGGHPCGHLEIKTNILRLYIELVEAEIVFGQTL
jgi:hypothetical protein